MIRLFDFIFSFVGIIFLWPVGLVLYVIGLFHTGSRSYLGRGGGERARGKE